MKRVIKLSTPETGKLLACLSLTLLMSGCASLQEQQSTSVASSRSAAAAAQQQAQSDNSAAAPDTAPVVSAAEQAGINREGRVIQFGRVAEAAPSVQAPVNDVVELNYEQEDLRLVIEQLGGVLGLNMLIDPTIDAKVSLRTAPDNSLNYQDIWPLLRLLTRNAGVSVEQSGSLWQFRKDASSVPSDIVLPGWLDEAEAGIVLQLTPLKYISVEAASTILQPMLSEGSLLTLGASNLLGISAPPGQLQRINALLGIVDDDPFQNQGIQLYELRNSPAAEVGVELTEVLKLIEGEQSSYQVMALERINAVLVVAPATRGFEEVSRWIRILDADSGDQVEQLFVYRVKNLKAESLADTLSQVFAQEDDESMVFRTPAGAGNVTSAQSSLTPQGGFLASLVNAAGQDAASANITVTIVDDEETNSLLIRATPREYRQLLSTISSLDRATPQVLINAVIGQVTLTDGNRFGIDWTRISGNLSSGPAQLSTNFLPTRVVDANGEIAPGTGLVLTKSFMDGSAVIDATLNAIAEDNDVTLLARPTILAINNKEGKFHVGQSVPINNGTTIGTGGVSTENIGYQNVGIDLTITPQINDEGYIRMDIEQSLSSVEEGGATGVGDNPTFTDQEIITSVVVADQATITLGGLIQEESSDQQTGIPGLQKIPVMGRLFSYTDQKNTRRELFVILRPQIIYGDQRDEISLREHRETFTHVHNLLKEAGL